MKTTRIFTTTIVALFLLVSIFNRFTGSEALVIPAVMVAFIMLLPMLAIMSIVLIVNSVRHKDKLIFLDIFDLMVCLVMAYILISNA